ncbi:ASCH domain-containing protein [archaeon]|nr:MAG: ASCH domain-containing protein [archaeon]
MEELDFLKVHTSHPWYGYIRTGLKTIEGRLNRGEFARIKPGDWLEFFNDEDHFVKVVIACDIYVSFEEYLTDKGLTDTLPGITSLQDGINVYYQYYTVEDERNFGVLALTLQDPK